MARVKTAKAVGKKDLPEQTYEQIVERLQTIVDKLEAGEVPLEQSLQMFEEGMRLARQGADKLEQAEKKVEMLVKGRNGVDEIVPFEPPHGNDSTNG